jgi:nicotinate-nucleotide pyrophosphorylase (carboxylating)
VDRDFQQITWDERLEADWRKILRLAVREDLGPSGDWTTRALVPEGAAGRAAVVARQSGIVAGLCGVEATLHEINPQLSWQVESEDGRPVEPGTRLGRIEGPAQGILMAERLVLNLLGRLSGIATLTGKYVEAVAGTKARIYDTRKTTPGWRRLEKYAVQCGGGCNHRTGLFEAVLIKDNHLAFGAEAEATPYTPAEAVARARQFVAEHCTEPAAATMLVEIEVDTLKQFDEVLSAGPDIVLLDNMAPDILREAVARRDARGPQIELEASGGVNLESVRAIAHSGIDRISVGALTHSAVCLDIGLDWLA